MRRFIINSLFILLVLFTTVPVFGSEANYDSNGVTTFYGKYEYPKENPEKKPPVKEKESGNPSAEGKMQDTAGGTTQQLANSLPSYKGEGPIIPATGDTSNLLASLIGCFLLVLVFFKLKEVGNTEKSSIR